MSRIKFKTIAIDKRQIFECACCDDQYNAFFFVKLYLTSTLFIKMNLCKKCRRRVQNYVERHNGVIQK